MHPITTENNIAEKYLLKVQFIYNGKFIHFN